MGFPTGRPSAQTSLISRCITIKPVLQTDRWVRRIGANFHVSGFPAEEPRSAAGAALVVWAGFLRSAIVENGKRARGGRFSRGRNQVIWDGRDDMAIGRGRGS